MVSLLLGPQSVSSRRLVELPSVGPLPEGRMVDLPGRGSTFVVEAGNPDGAPLILLHALGCTGLLTWYPALEALGARHRLVIFDQRWHGRGIRSPRFRLEDCADDVPAIADALGIDRFTAVGYSMGSLVAQLTWRAHPDRVEGLVLGAATASFRRAPRERIALDAIARSVSTVRPNPGMLRLADVPHRSDSQWALAQFRQTSPGALSTAIAEVGKFDSSAWIGEVDVPTAVIVPNRDKVIPPRRQRWLARQIDGSAAYEVDGGHASCVMKADQFIPALQAACASVLSRTDRSRPGPR